MANNKKYMWVVSCNDGSYYDKSEKAFDNLRDAYNDMRNHALEKMKWNTEYDEDFEDDDEAKIGYNISFSRNKIVHESYSGIYTYEIKEYAEEETARIIIDFNLTAPDTETLKEIEDYIRKEIVEQSNIIKSMMRKYVKNTSVQGVQHIR